MKVSKLTAAITDQKIKETFSEVGALECVQRNKIEEADVAFKRSRARDDALKIENIGNIKIKVEAVADAEPMHWTTWEQEGDAFGGKKRKGRAGAV